MNKQELVSIVVPVYNVEDYLGYCVESLVNQSYQNIEIILVNDGSTDNSRERAQSWVDRDKRVKLFDKPNGGLSDARNFGVEKASADWIVFCDSDDYYDSIAIDYLMGLQNKYSVGLVMTPLRSVSTYQNIAYSNDERLNLDSAEILDSERALEQAYLGKGSPSACGKLLKKEVLINYPYPLGKLYEDMRIIHLHLHAVDKVCLGNQRVYNYYKRQGSITRAEYTPRQMEAIEAMEEQRDFIEKRYPNSSVLHRAFNIRLIMMSFHVIETMLNSKMYKEIRIFLGGLRTSVLDYFKSPEKSLKSKIRLLLLMLSPRFYNVVRKLESRVAK